MPSMQLIFIHGPAACGKYTIAKRVAETSGMRLFHNHLVVDLATALFEFGSDPFVRLRESIWLSAFAEAAEQGQSLVFTFQPESTVRPDFPERVVATVSERGGEVLFVELVCPEEEIERRVENASRAEFGKLRSLEDYRQLRDSGAFEYAAMPTSVVRIDTSEQPAQKSAEMIRECLQARSWNRL